MHRIMRIGGLFTGSPIKYIAKGTVQIRNLQYLKFIELY